MLLQAASFGIHNYSKNGDKKTQSHKMFNDLKFCMYLIAHVVLVGWITTPSPLSLAILCHNKEKSTNLKFKLIAVIPASAGNLLHTLTY